MDADLGRTRAQAASWARAYAQAADLDAQRVQAWVALRALAEAHGQGWSSPTIIADFQHAAAAFTL